MDGIISCSRSRYRKTAQARAKSDDVLDCFRRNVDKRTRRDLNDSDDE